MNYIPESNEEYANVEYWNKRYETEDYYDWFKEYKYFRNIIKDIVKEDQKILMLGCGNSNLSEEMYKDGYRNIVNIDYSPVVIDKMRNHCDKCSSMDWLVMDIRNLEFADETFDVIIEKGTLDAMLVGEKDPWRLSSVSEQLIEHILEQIRRVLKKDGRFISITFSQLHFRRKLFARREYDWSFDHFTFGNMFKYVVYLMVKGRPLSKSVLDAMKPSSSSSLETRKELDETNREEVFSQDSEQFLSNICPDF